jgi:hypothetical protein
VPAALTAAPTPSKLTIRARSPRLIAVRLATPQAVHLADGREFPARVGDWLITHGRTTVDLVGDSQLTARYTVDDEGARTLSSAICARLEQTTGVGSTRTPEDLCTAVERLAKIAVGTIQIDFTPGQLEEIAYRATKRGHTITQELQAVVDRIREELFWKS